MSHSNQSDRKRRPEQGFQKEPEFKYTKMDHPLRQKSSFFTQMKFQSIVPEPQPTPHLYEYPFDPMRFVTYKTTSLEKNFKYDILTEPNLGVNIDLIYPKTYEVDKSIKLAPQDAQILFDENTDLKSKKKPRVKEAWLLQTQRQEFQQQYNIVDLKKKHQNDEEPETMESKLEEIEKSFSEANKKPIHPKNPELVAESIVPVFPDEMLWSNVYTQVTFDSDPIPSHLNKEVGRHAIFQEIQSQPKMILGYLLPRGSGSSDDLEEYDWIRDYDMTMQRLKDNQQKSVALVMQGDMITYVPLVARIQMTKNKSNFKDEEDERLEFVHPERVLVTKRKFNKQEEADRKKRSLEVNV